MPPKMGMILISTCSSAPCAASLHKRPYPAISCLLYLRPFPRTRLLHSRENVGA